MLITNSKKNVLMLCVAAASIAVVVWFTNNTQNLSTSTQAMQNEMTQTNAQSTFPSVTQNVATPSAQAVTQTTQPTVSPVAAQFQSIMGNPADKAEINNWFDARGYLYSGETSNEYGSYDEDTLKKLSDGGDIRAMKKLGDLYLLKYGSERAKEVYVNAAVHGSTEALQSIGTMVKVNEYLINAKTPEAKQVAVIETLAWYNAAVRRGDRWPEIMDSKAFIKIYKIVGTKEMNTQVLNRSQEIYDELAQKRRDLGLGEFDNSIPASVENYFQQLEMP